MSLRSLTTLLSIGLSLLAGGFAHAVNQWDSADAGKKCKRWGHSGAPEYGDIISHGKVYGPSMGGVVYGNGPSQMPPWTVTVPAGTPSTLHGFCQNALGQSGGVYAPGDGCSELWTNWGCSDVSDPNSTVKIPSTTNISSAATAADYLSTKEGVPFGWWDWWADADPVGLDDYGHANPNLPGTPAHPNPYGPYPLTGLPPPPSTTGSTGTTGSTTATTTGGSSGTTSGGTSTGTTTAGGDGGGVITDAGGNPYRPPPPSGPGGADPTGPGALGTPLYNVTASIFQTVDYLRTLLIDWKLKVVAAITDVHDQFSIVEANINTQKTAIVTEVQNLKAAVLVGNTSLSNLPPAIATAIEGKLQSWFIPSAASTTLLMGNVNRLQGLGPFAFIDQISTALNAPAAAAPTFKYCFTLKIGAANTPACIDPTPWLTFLSVVRQVAGWAFWVAYCWFCIKFFTPKMVVG